MQIELPNGDYEQHNHFHIMLFMLRHLTSSHSIFLEYLDLLTIAIMCAIKITIIINYLCYHSLYQMHAMFRCDEICEMIFTCHK